MMDNPYLGTLPDPDFYRLAIAVEREWWNRWTAKHRGADAVDKVGAVLTRIAAALHDNVKGESE